MSNNNALSSIEDMFTTEFKSTKSKVTLNAFSLFGKAVKDFDERLKNSNHL